MYDLIYFHQFPMRHHPLGDSSITVSEVCLGTMTFGQQNSESEAHAQLDLAFAHGVNFIDAAEMYPVPARQETCGRTEEIVGTWLAKKPREKIILATKVAGPSRNLGWIRNGPRALDEPNIRAAVENSLRRLQTSYIDLYQIHWPARNVPMFGNSHFDPKAERPMDAIGEQLAVLGRLVQEGKIRTIGLSNETPWGVMQFLREAESRGLPRIVSVQNAYHLANRTWENGLDEISFREKVGLLAYSPLAFGFLSGKYITNPQAQGRITQFANFGQRYANAHFQQAVASYCELARSAGWSPAQMALAYVAAKHFVTSTIIGATTLPQLTENLAAFDKQLPPSLVDGIEAIHLRSPNPAP